MDRCVIPPRGLPEAAGEPLPPDAAAKAAALCFAAVFCRYCDVCRLLCPDLCITRDPESGRIGIDLAYCKGCGLCAHYCPKGAIRMIVETK